MVLEGILLRQKKLLRHIALTLDGEAADMSYAINARQTLVQVYEKRNNFIQQLIAVQVRQNIPVITVLLLSGREKDSEQFTVIADSLVKLFSQLKNNEELLKHQVKVAVLGKWYDLPGRVVDEIKDVINATMNNERFFFNICVRYDGQEEIVDACKLVTRKAVAEKIDPESITREMIKENVYLMLPPPDVIIVNNWTKTSGFMLWDSADANMVFTNKPWQEFTLQDFMKVLR